MAISITDVITNDDDDASKLVQFAQDFVNKGADGKMNRTQVRNIFTEARKIESIWHKNPESAFRKLNMLKPKMAYQAKRHKALAPLVTHLTSAIEEVSKAEKGNERTIRFQRFMELFEAILAYHYEKKG